MRSTSSALGVVVVLGALAACSEAGGEVRGGGLTDAGVSATTPPPAPPDILSTCRGTGTTWSDLYNDVFGPTGEPGSCSFRGNCHGSADAAGARSGAGIECFDRAGCRQSFLDKNLVSPDDAAAPEESGLLLGLLRYRRADGSTVGFMPQEPANFYFPDSCLERIKTWIAGGAKDD
ncbi:MAG: hypothetical protein K0S65_3568 [Labilithrix sp.]|nr:hypothetical protein [Labilithrix sp.]